MAAFVTDLWESIFTPGPTQSLLLATNATFGCLQLLLLVLLVATHSIHFLVLSVLCGGLWWAINWFAAELGQVRQQQEREARDKKAAEQHYEKSDSETEVEASTVLPTTKESGSKEVEPVQPGGELRRRAAESPAGVVDAGEGGAASTAGASTKSTAILADAIASGGLQSSESTTEDEWEKVSEHEKDK